MGQHKDRMLQGEVMPSIVVCQCVARSAMLHRGTIPATRVSTHLYLVEDCRKGRKDTGDMIRCCMCAQWFHFECLNLNKAEATGVWAILQWLPLY